MGTGPVSPLISIIVPVWEDDQLVAELVKGLTGTSELCEWIVVAVRPGEVLRDLDRDGAIRLISCDEPSRGKQQNLGAAVARGELLCFHHADSELRPEHLAALVRVAKDGEVVGGAFHRRFILRECYGESHWSGVSTGWLDLCSAINRYL